MRGHAPSVIATARICALLLQSSSSDWWAPASVPAHYDKTNQLVRPGRDAGPYQFGGARPVQKVKNYGDSYKLSLFGARTRTSCCLATPMCNVGATPSKSAASLHACPSPSTEGSRTARTAERPRIRGQSGEHRASTWRVRNEEPKSGRPAGRPYSRTISAAKDNARLPARRLPKATRRSREGGNPETGPRIKSGMTVSFRPIVRKFSRNGDTLLGKPAVAPARQPVNTFENRYIIV